MTSVTMSSPSCPSLVPPACQVCHKTDDLVFCRNCLVMPYCGWTHHRENQPDHLDTCLAIGVETLTFQMSEQKLQLIQPSPFETHVGRFCLTESTRQYIENKFGLVVGLVRRLGYVGGHRSVVETARTHCNDMLRLDRSDAHCVRYLLPALDVRLGGDQAAYDLIKWYATTGSDDAYRWDDVEMPYLDVKNANMLESTDGWWASLPNADLGHTIPLVLIKLRLLYDLQAIQSAKRHLGLVLPLELTDKILDDAVSTATTVQQRPIHMRRCSLMERSRMIQTLKSQIIHLYKSIHRYNPFIWQFIVDRANLRPPLGRGSNGSGRPDEARAIAGCNYASWAETPRALKALQTLANML